MERHIKELPQDHEIVLYCTCPNEASAAKVAKLLMSYGFRRVRPLNGGLDAWIAAGYAVETLSDAKVNVLLKKRLGNPSAERFAQFPHRGGLLNSRSTCGGTSPRLANRCPQPVNMSTRWSPRLL